MRGEKRNDGESVGKPVSVAPRLSLRKFGFNSEVGLINITIKQANRTTRILGNIFEVRVIRKMGPARLNKITDYHQI